MKKDKEWFYKETKKQYWDLIKFFLMRPKSDHTKQCIEELQKGWKEFEKSLAEVK